MYEDRDNVLWFGGSTGLSRYAGGRFDTVRIVTGRTVVDVEKIVENSSGQLWLATNVGAVRISKASYTQAAHGSGTLTDPFIVLDDLPGVTTRAAAEAPDGSLWFATDETLAIVDPPQYDERVRVALPTRVTEFDANGTAVRTATTPALAPGTNRLEFHYTALNLTSPQRTRFRYRLDGFDPNWIEAGDRRSALYVNVPPGAYTFEVQAALDGGAWLATPASAAFVLKPFLYQQRWFPFASASLVVAALAGIWYVRAAQMRKRFSILIAERARVSREVHDTVLQSLVGVSIQCEAMARAAESASMQQRLLGLRRQVDEYVREARESVWNLRSSVLNELDFTNALRREGERAVGDSEISLEISTSGSRRCPPAVEQQLLRVGREAIANAVHHARPTRIVGDVHIEPTSVRLRIEDDGQGFDVEQLLREPNGHCGLLAMRERAELIGGTVTISSVIGRGTVVEAVVPLAPTDMS